MAFLDDDAEADADWLKHLGAAYEHDGVLGVGGAIEPAWQRGPARLVPGRVRLGRRLHLPRHARVRGARAQPDRREHVVPARASSKPSAGSTRASAGWARCPLGCEETELCIRAGARWPGRTFLYEPQARVQHKVPGDRGRWSYFRARCYGEGLSKAAVSRLAGSDARPRVGARLRPPHAAARRRARAEGRVGPDRSGLRRAGAIIVGLATTTAGYMRGRVSRHVQLPAPEIASPHPERYVDNSCNVGSSSTSTTG